MLEFAEWRKTEWNEHVSRLNEDELVRGARDNIPGRKRRPRRYRREDGN